MPRQLNQKERHRAVFEYERLGSYAKVAKLLKCCPKTVRKWVLRDKEGLGLQRKARNASARCVNQAAAEEASRQLIEGRQGGARFVAAELHKSGLVRKKPSHQSVIRAVKALHQAGGDEIDCTRGKPAPQLTEKNRADRVAWCRAHLKTDWSKVMFTDRKKFHFRYPGSKVLGVQWHLRSQSHKCGVFQPNNPSAYNVYGGLTAKGTTRLRPVTGTTKVTTRFSNCRGQPARSITKQEYQAVLSESLLPDGMARLGPDWTFQQDNDPTHGAIQKALPEFNKIHSSRIVLLRNWPAHSPDLSPIENCWAYAEWKASAKGCTNFDDYKRTVDRIFKNIPAKMIRNLYDSMPRRLEACINNEGHRVKW